MEPFGYIRDDLRMQRFFQKAVETGRVTIVVVALISLVVSGLIAIDRLPAKVEKKTEAPADSVVVAVEGPATDQVCIEESDQPADPKDASESMTPSGKPSCQPVAYLVSAEVNKPDNSNDSSRLDEQDEDAVPVHVEINSTRTATCTSCAQVKPSLGRQFTLVGARPSGTS